MLLRSINMKILVIVHLFPPKDSAGTEVYAHHLAHELQGRGNDVVVFHTEKDPDRPQYDLSQRESEGLPTYCVIHNHQFPTFRHTYVDEHMEGHLRSILDEVRPDVVHCQHLNLHSIGYLEIIKNRGIPIVYTLAEYLLLCPRNGWLVRPGFELCSSPSAKQCARCTLTWPPPTGAFWPRRVHRFLGKMKVRLGFNDARYVEANRIRRTEIQDQLSHVDLFIAPSQFLADRFTETGMIDAERVLTSDYGFDHSPFEGDPPPSSSARPDEERAPLRLGFTGAISEWKGVHLLVEACNRFRSEEVSCEVYGRLDSFPSYIKRLRSSQQNSVVDFKGPFNNREIARVLSRFDVLVVPSMWYENSPLTIHEAFLAGIPVITCDCGGMAELVDDGISGLHFKRGDAEDLARVIRRLLDEPDLLQALKDHIPAVKKMGDDARDMEQRFRSLIEGRKPVR